MERRYFFYLMSINQIANVGMFVPAILYSHRFNGAFMSLLLAVPLGSLLVALYIRFITRLPKASFPELLEEYAPPWMEWFSKITMIVIWYWVGLVALLSFVKLTHRFLDPETSEYVILTVFLVLVLYASQIRTRSILLGLEILIAINLPLLAAFLLKLFTEKATEWDSAIEPMTYLWHMPELDSLAAATFVFSGYANLTIYQKELHPDALSFKRFWLVPLAGFLSLFIGYFAPFMYHGTYGIMNYPYVWLATADSMRMELFVIERMIFIFLFIYISISMVSIIVHWHISHTVTVNVFSRVKMLKRAWIPRLPAIGFAGIAYALIGRLTEESLLEFSRWFMVTRLFTEFLLIAFVWYMARRRGKHEADGAC